MIWHLARGRSLVLFPEGTTTDGTTVRPFHARLLQAPLRARCRVQPVALRYLEGDRASRTVPFLGDAGLVPHMWRLLGAGEIVAEVHLGAAAMPGADRRALARATHAQVCALLGLAPAPVLSVRRPRAATA